jgi:hypothetical protein
MRMTQRKKKNRVNRAGLCSSPYLKEEEENGCSTMPDTMKGYSNLLQEDNCTEEREVGRIPRR